METRDAGSCLEDGLNKTWGDTEAAIQKAQVSDKGTNSKVSFPHFRL